jgi:hypothetical protein
MQEDDNPFFECGFVPLFVMMYNSTHNVGNDGQGLYADFAHYYILSHTLK